MQEEQFFGETECLQSDLITENYKDREEMHKNDTIITVSKLYYALRLIHVFVGVTEKAKRH